MCAIFFPSTHVFNVTDRNQSLKTRKMTMRMRMTTMRKKRMTMKNLHLIQVYKRGLQLNLLQYPLQHSLLLENAYSLLLNHAEMFFFSIWINRYHVLTPLKLYLRCPIPFQLTLLPPQLACPTFSLVLTMAISETMIYTPL